MWTITIHPRFGDTDLLGHINNTALPVWFEQARNPLFKIFAPDLNLKPETFHLIMAHTDFDFLDELFFQYPVEIRTGVSRIGNKSFTVYHEAWQQGRFCAAGHAVIVHYDFTAKCSTPLPESEKRLLAEHIIEERKERG